MARCLLKGEVGTPEKTTSNRWRVPRERRGLRAFGTTARHTRAGWGPSSTDRRGGRDQSPSYKKTLDTLEPDSWYRTAD